MHSKGILTIICFSLVLASCESTAPQPTLPKTECDVITHDVQHNDKKDLAFVETGTEIGTTALHEPAEYILEMQIGSNEDKVLMVIDTGSSSALIANPACQRCSKTTYDPSKSTTSKPIIPTFPSSEKICSGVTNGILLGFGSGSACGQEVEDDLGLTCGPKIKTTIVNTVASSRVPNILGLAGKGLLQGGIKETFLDQIVASSTTTIEPIFAFTACGVKKGSQFILGGPDKRIKADYKCVKRTKGFIPDSFWYASPTQLKRDGEVIATFDDPKEPAESTTEYIMDTGTTLSCLPKAVQDAMEEHVKTTPVMVTAAIPDVFYDAAQSGNKDDYAKKLPPGVTSQLPTFQVVFEGCDGSGSTIEIDWTPEAYMKRWTNDTHTFGIRELGTSPCPPSQAIFGQTFMDDKSTLFNKRDSTISFAPNGEACTAS